MCSILLHFIFEVDENKFLMARYDDFVKKVGDFTNQAFSICIPKQRYHKT